MQVSRGTCYLRGKLWTINYTVNGRRVREAIGTDRKLALQVLAKRTSAAVENREFDIKPREGTGTFNQLCDAYLTRHVNALKSARRERDRVEAWRKMFGARTLASITAAELLDWRANKLARLDGQRKLPASNGVGSASAPRNLGLGNPRHCKPATVNRDMMRLKSMLGRACEWGMLRENPARTIKPLRENNRRERYLSPAECASLISACTGEIDTKNCPGSLVGPLVIVALHTGLRLGEIRNLRWQDVDWHSGQLSIRDSKNGEGRVVPLDGAVLALLKIRRGQMPEGLSACKDEPPEAQEFIFERAATWGRDGSRCPGGGRLGSIKRAFKTACKRARLKDLRFHDLRHTYASRFIQSGGSLYALQKLLGHKSIAMTQRYAHLSPGYLKDEAARMNGMWEVPTPKDEMEMDDLADDLAISADEIDLEVRQ